MRSASATALLVCLASALPAQASAPQKPGGSAATHLVWLLESPAAETAAVAGPPSSLWTLNATLTADSIVIHHADGSTTDSVVHPLVSHETTTAQAAQWTLDPFDPTRVAALESWTGGAALPPQGAAGQSPWLISLLPAHPRSLKLRGKNIPDLDPRHVHRWLLSARPASGGAQASEVPLLEVTAMPSSDQRLDHRPVALHYTVQPVGRTIVPAGPGVSSQWSAPGDAGIIAAGPANEAQNSTRLESAGRERTGKPRVFARDAGVASYSQLLATQLDQQTLPWTWPSALGVVGKWSTGVDGQGLSDRVHQGCHRVHQAWKQVSPFRGSARPLLTSLGQSLPRPGLKASALAHKVHDADVKKALGRPVAAASGLTAALFHGLARQWREADGPKQTFMAVFAVLQVVWLACTVKGWLDRLFGRKAEYRNRRTKTLARKAALAAAGGRGAASKPQPRTWSSGKPRLPPRPTAGHPLMPLGPQRGTSGDNRMQQQGARTLSTTNELETTPSGDIILPSWTENGPSSLMVIVEEPELEQKEAEEAERRIYTHSKKRSDYDRMAGEWDDDNSEGDDSTGCLEQGWSSSNLGGGPASSRLSFQSDSGSLRYRERSVAASLPFYDDVVSTSSASTSSSPPMPRADDAIVTELESAWCRADRAELERGWRDSCMEEGAL